MSETHNEKSNQLNEHDERMLSLAALSVHELGRLVLDLEQRNNELQQRLEASNVANHGLISDVLKLEERDHLTGGFNRVGLERAYSRLTTGNSRSSDAASKHSIIFVDLDHFGNINKAVGHGKGDELLILTSQVMRTNVREHEGDCIGRYAGDEFIILLSQCPPDLAFTISERIRNEVRKIPSILGLSFELGLSAGVTEINPAMSFGEARDAADYQMSQAKIHGRGQTRLLEA